MIPCGPILKSLDRRKNLMRHVRALLACTVALSAAACAQTPTTPAPASFDGTGLGSGHYSAPVSPRYSGNYFGSGNRDGTSTTTTSTTSTTDSTTVTGGGNRGGNYFGGG
jgi:hypothetical protein